MDVYFYRHERDTGSHHQYWTGNGQAVLLRCVVSNVRIFECAMALVGDLLLVSHDKTLRNDSFSLSYEAVVAPSGFLSSKCSSFI